MELKLIVAFVKKRMRSGEIDPARQAAIHRYPVCRGFLEHMLDKCVMLYTRLLG